MTPRPLFLALALSVALAGCNRGVGDAAPSAATSAAAPATAEDRAAQLDRVYADYWEAVLKLNPVQATFQGDHRYDDQLPDLGSKQFRDEQHALTSHWLEQVKAIGSDGLEGQDLLSYEIFVRNAEMSLASEMFPSWMLPVNQMGSIASYSVMLGSGTSAQPFKTVEDYDNWLARANRLPVLIDTEIANMREGIAAGVVQPRVVMEKVLPQLDAIITDKPEDSQFWGPIMNLPADFSAADKARLTGAYRTMIADALMPALQRQRAFIADEYLPKTRDTVGLAALPGGEAWYTFAARNSTTTTKTPAQIHQIGLDEVARIHGEMRKVMEQVGFEGSLQDFFRFMQNDRQFEFKSEQALLEHYRALEEKVMAGVPKLFSLTPEADFEIRPIEAFRARSAAGGEYMSPSEDGSRPGVFYVNTYDLPTRKTWDAEDLFLHEAIPGHHFQLALQQELPELPAFRRFGGETAFIEGWGLYAEGLGKDLGVYTDPYSWFGRLQGELWRAVRLVVDTGLHSKGWTRQQVLDYMFENSSVSEPDAIAEAERYIAWPGQALAYKIGELKIKELRARAEEALGERFDVREFHAEVLKDGSVPLDILEQKIDRWIAAKAA